MLQAQMQAGAYATVTPQSLKIISINTDFWYKVNYFNYVNTTTTNPDNSGMLRFLINELQAAENAGQRVWIIGHVPAGYDGSNLIINPPNLFYAIVQRYCPATIAGIFWGTITSGYLQSLLLLSTRQKTALYLRRGHIILRRRW